MLESYRREEIGQVERGDVSRANVAQSVVERGRPSGRSKAVDALGEVLQEPWPEDAEKRTLDALQGRIWD